jgi:hypothetical protein
VASTSAQVPSAFKNKFYSPAFGAGTKPDKPAKFFEAPPKLKTSKE